MPPEGPRHWRKDIRTCPNPSLQLPLPWWRQGPVATPLLSLAGTCIPNTNFRVRLCRKWSHSHRDQQRFGVSKGAWGNARQVTQGIHTLIGKENAWNHTCRDTMMRVKPGGMDSRERDWQDRQAMLVTPRQHLCNEKIESRLCKRAIVIRQCH